MTTAQDALRIAWDRGFRPTPDGLVQTPSGNIVGARDKFDGYPRFSVKVGTCNHKVFVHRLVAFAKFGDAMFAPGTHVRHLDNVKTNNTAANIAIGSTRDNCLDRPAAERREHSHRVALKRRKFTPDEVATMRCLFHAGGWMLREIRDAFGVCSNGHVSSIVNRKIYVRQ